MQEQPLDAPLEQSKIALRAAYSMPMEAGLLALNNLVCFGGWMGVLWMSWDQGVGPFGVFLMILVSIWTVAPCLYIWRWRRASLLYERTGTLQLLRELKMGGVPFVRGGVLLCWTVYLTFVGLLWWSFWDELRIGLFLIPGILLGPLQYLYFKKTVNLTQQVLAASRER